MARILIGISYLEMLIKGSLFYPMGVFSGLPLETIKFINLMNKEIFYLNLGNMVKGQEI